MRVVLDTNVIIAALAADGLCRNLVRRRLHAHVLLSSPGLLSELVDTLRRKFGEHPGRLPLLALYRKRLTLVEPSLLEDRVCRDADDDLVLATALAARADVIVTGDDDLITLRAFQGIRILSPRQFLQMLDA